MHTVTNTVLLVGLKDPQNQEVWQSFFKRYQPMLVAYGRRVGLSDADAEDASQDALLAFAEFYRVGRYEREKGRLRTWLYGIASNKILQIRRRRQRRRSVENPDAVPDLEQVADEKSMTDLWEEEWQRAVLAACMVEIREHFEPSTCEAFDLFVRQGLPGDEVARRVGISRDAVFKAKSRILSKMREIRERLEKEW